MAPDPRAVVRAWGVVLTTRIPWIRSIRVRAMAVVVLVVLMPLGLVTLAGIDERRVGARLADDVREGAEEAARDSADLDGIARRLDLRLRVYDAQGTLVAQVDHEAGTNPLAGIGALFFGDDGAPSPHAFDDTLGPVEARPEVRAAGPLARAECRTSPGGKLLACSAARRQGDRLVYAQASSRRAVRALYDVRYEISKLVVILLPAGLLLAWWLGARTVRPIEQLRAKVLASAARGSPSPQLEFTRRDEIGDLAAAFDGLLRTLDERRLANEAFVADLVHEFKNPVAAIRASAEQLGAGSSNPRTERLVRVLEESSERLDLLVSQFLELARAEAGLPSEAWAPVDLAELARGVVESVRGDPRWNGVTLRVRAPAEPALAPGVSLRLDSALRNLIENAASFALPSGEVSVTVEPSATSVDIAIQD
ncbi:MAG TPA: histidine kinase dimerization/phospho-acceptor domain-containing protein, partial [Polyangiaceae bacterium]